MQGRNTPTRPVRRPEAQPAESDVAAIFERRLLARGIRPDDFLDWRGSSDPPAIPTITPIRFGRGADDGAVSPMAAAIPEAVQAVPETAVDPDESDPTGEPDAN